MEGQIVKIISNDYFVKTNNNNIFVKQEENLDKKILPQKLGTFAYLMKKKK